MLLSLTSQFGACVLVCSSETMLAQQGLAGPHSIISRTRTLKEAATNYVQ